MIKSTESPASSILLAVILAPLLDAAVAVRPSTPDVIAAAIVLASASSATVTAVSEVTPLCTSWKVSV